MMCLIRPLCLSHWQRCVERFDSDVDVAIQLNHVMDAQEKMLWVARIAACLGRSVDLVDLNVVGQPLLGQIIKHGKRLVGDDAAYAALLRRNAFDQADFYLIANEFLMRGGTHG
ncbi:hypothetical protein JYT13_01820 [Mariprofundus ferrooxydans]|nr:hypothetical protein [Mariprofundus ferrooxydans]